MMYKNFIFHMFHVIRIVACDVLFAATMVCGVGDNDLGVSPENAGTSTAAQLVIANRVASEVPARDRASDEYLFNASATMRELERRMIEDPTLVNKKDRFGVTALMRAAQDGNLEKVELFLRYNADVNAVSDDHLYGTDMTIDRGGSVALHYALYYGNNPHVYKIVQALLKYGADAQKRNRMLEMPIHYLREVQSIPIKRALLKMLVDGYKVDINAQGYNGDTILHQAVAKNDLPFIEALNEYRIRLKYRIKNDKGLTPLEYAQSMSRDMMMRALTELASPSGIRQEGGYIVNAPEDQVVEPDGITVRPEE